MSVESFSLISFWIIVAVLFSYGVVSFLRLIGKQTASGYHPSILFDIDVAPSESIDGAELCFSTDDHFENVAFDFSHTKNMRVYFTLHKNTDEKKMFQLNNEMVSCGYIPAPASYLLSAVERVRHENVLDEEIKYSGKYNFTSLHNEMIHEKQDHLGIEGNPKLRMTISPDGKLVEYEESSDIDCLLGYLKKKDFSENTSHPFSNN